ncbi:MULTISPECIES: hypothetical protein [Rhizobium]|uniref:Dihydrodipicolinate synthetase family protein n=1 Tax=Rhizobium laguerreae TaxID=1076926 RepID=A0AAX2QET2_9HYPH|nr:MULTISPECIES: hypothetical protein [Rhizobium]TCU19423.1 hypothetical protein EV131_11323 [Rhizobium laguerreae]
MTMTRPYSGLFAVAPTAFTDNGDVDFDGQRRVLDIMTDQGVDGLCNLANYSEQFLLSDTSRADRALPPSCRRIRAHDGDLQSYQHADSKCARRPRRRTRCKTDHDDAALSRSGDVDPLALRWGK